MFKYCLILAVCFAAASCSTGKIITRSVKTETVKHDSASVVIDTTKNQTVTISTYKEIYGDILIGSLAFTDEQVNQMETKGFAQEDSLESGGIKINVSLVPFKGGIKTVIKAVSKPKESIATHTAITNEQKGISVTKKVAAETTSAQTEKTITKKGFPWVWAIGILAFLIIIIILIILKKIYG